MSSENEEKKSGYDIDTDPLLSEEQKKRLKDNKIIVRVEQSQEGLERDKFWSEAVGDIQTEYEKLGKSFDPSSIKTKDDIENAFQNIMNLKEQKNQRVPSYGTPLTGAQTGEPEPTTDRNIADLKANTQNLPLDLVEFHSESEMRNFLLELSRDTNDPRCAEAQKLYSKLLHKAMSDNVNLEMTSTGSDYAQKKAKFRKVNKGED